MTCNSAISFASPALQVFLGSPLVLLLAFQDLVAGLPGVRVPARLLVLSGIANARISFTQSKMAELHVPALNFFTKPILPFLSYRAFHQK